MKKRLLMIAALMLTFVGSSFALNVGDYAYNKTQRLKITGANLVTNGNFANARDVRNFMEHAISNHATRVVSMEGARGNKELLATIEPEDLQDWD